MEKLLRKIAKSALGFVLASGLLGVLGISAKKSIGVMSASGDSYSFKAVSGTPDGEIWSFSCTQNGSQSAPVYNAKSQELRLYSGKSGNKDGCSITIAVNDDSQNLITGIEFTATASYTPEIKWFESNVVVAGGGVAGTWSANKTSYTPATGVSAITLQNTNAASSPQLRLKSVKVTYSTTVLTANLTSITATSTQTEVYCNDSLDNSKITVVGHYDDGIDRTISSGWTVSCDTSVVAENVPATVSYVHEGNTLTSTFNVNVVAIPAESLYTLVNDITQITVGSKVLIAGTSGGDIRVAKKYKSGDNNLKSAIAQPNGSGMIIKSLEMSAMMIGVSSKGYTLLDEGSSYLYPDSNTFNHLKGKTTIGDDAFWKIAYENNSFSVTSTKSGVRGVMQFNSGSSIFSCYASASQSPVNLYVLDPNPSISDKLSTFGNLFLRASEDALVVEETGVQGTDCINNGYYLAAKAALANKWSSVKEALRSDVTGLALRYQAWARASGDLAPYDGNATIVSNAIKLLSSSNSADGSTAIITIIVSVLGAGAIAGYALNRKRRESL